jgi:hypothetical protein
MFDIPTANVSALRNSFTKIACWSFELIMFLYTGSSIQNAIEQFMLYIQFSFCVLLSLSNPTNKNVAELNLEIQTAPSR